MEGIQDLLQEGLLKYGKSVLKVCQLMKRTDEVFSWAVDEMQLQRDEQSKKGTFHYLVIY